MKIVGICASLRADSFNQKLLNQVAKEFDDNSFTLATWSDIPAFNADLLKSPFPESLLRLAEQIRQADGLVIAMPEYNFSIPGMFKNALDWLSKCENPPLAGKPVAIVSAATGALGGSRGQYSLRHVLLCMNAKVLSKPEVFVSFAAKKFDANGLCTDEDTLKVINSQMTAFKKSL
jgi:chromate reductase